MFLRMKPSFINLEGHIGTVFDVGHQIETVIRGRFGFFFDYPGGSTLKNSHSLDQIIEM